MTTIHKPLKNREGRKRFARIMKHRLTLLIALLIVLLLALIFRAGNIWWPVWLVEHQKQIAGVIVLAILCLVLLSPVIIEADSNPRGLDGPGKNPYL
jgi:hypothetical protein